MPACVSGAGGEPYPLGKLIHSTGERCDIFGRPVASDIPGLPVASGRYSPCPV
jgi:hypothetical protein